MFNIIIYFIYILDYDLDNIMDFLGFFCIRCYDDNRLCRFYLE